jgi:hypothetical protein
MAKEVPDQVAYAAGGFFSFAITCILMAFLIGVGMGIGARQFYATIYSPDAVLPQAEENE